MGIAYLLPLFPILVLAAGAGLMALSTLVRFRYPGSLATLAAGTAAIALVFMGQRLPLDLTLSAWRPATLLTTPLSLHVDGLEWLFSLAVVTVLLATLLTGASRTGGPRTRPRALALLLASAALLSLFSANLLTLAITWTLVDICSTLVMLLIGDPETAGEQATINIVLNSLSTLLVWAAMLFSFRDGSSLYFRLANFSAISTPLLAIAGVLRLGLYPLHTWLPRNVELRPGLVTMLHIAPASLGLALLGRLALLSQTALPLHDVLTTLGLAALLSGSILAWGQRDTAGSLTLIVLGQSGLVVLAGTWGGLQAGPALIAEGMVLILATGLLFVAPGLNRRTWYWSIPGTIAALALVGAPLTLGFAGRAVLLRMLVQAGAWPGLIGLWLGQSLLFATALRVAWRPLDTEGLRDGLVAIPTAVGLALPALPLLLIGLAPERLLSGVSASPRWSLGDYVSIVPAGGWLVMLFSILLGGALAWGALDVAPGARSWTWRALTGILDLRWLYRVAGRTVQLISQFVRTLALLPEGEGALTWTLLLVILLWLFLQPRR